MKAKKRTFANCIYFLPSSGYSWDIRQYNTYEEMQKDFESLSHSYAIAIDGQFVEIDRVTFDIFKD